jgi:flagellin-like hook-associated protein FlgL
MSFSINTNIASLQAQNYLRKSSNFQSQTISEVTSGLRIVNSGDDAAGLAIANGLRSDQAVLSQGIRNANDGLSSLQTIDGGINNISTLLDRARTLATQSASGTFTGDRSVLNSEFQSVISEIDRQAQSIGLNTGGQFAKALSVFVGGGRASSGVTEAVNGSVSVDLSNSTVDAKSLGLKGVQAQGNASVDLGAASSTSVQNIVNNAANQTSEKQAGYTTFSFKGPGFSDANAISISVNLAGVTDTQTLTAAINTAIQNAGNGATSAATAFKNSSISASVVTDSNGAQHLAFGSSSTAFEVQAGDQTSNALLGNLSSGTTGESLNTTYAGFSNLSTAAKATQATTIKLQFQGAGLTSADTLSVSVASGDSVSTVLSNLTSAIAADSNLAKAGITIASDANGAKLTFQSNSGQQFSVTAGGDVENLLGLGSQRLGSVSGSVAYATTTGTAYDNTKAVGTSNFEFSFNGAAGSSNAIAVDLSQGDATAGNVAGAGVTSGTADTSSANQLSLTIDGTKYNVDLSSASHNGATESLAQVATDITSALGVHGSATVNGSGQLVITSASKGAGSSVIVNAGANGSSDAAAALGLTAGAGAVTTAGLSRTGSDIANFLNQQFASSTTLQGAGLTASFVAGQLKVDSTNGTQFQLNAFGSSTAATVKGGGGSAASITGTATGSNLAIDGSNQNLALVIDGTQYNVTLTTGSRSQAQIAADIQTALTAQGSTATATTVGGAANGALLITSGTSGASSTITIGSTNPNDASALVGISTGAGTGAAATAAPAVTGTVANAVTLGANTTLDLTIDGVHQNVTVTGSTTTANVRDAINTAFGTTVASVDGTGHLVLASQTTGVTSNVTVTTGGANDAAAAVGLTNASNGITGAAATAGKKTGTATGNQTVTSSNNTLDLEINGTQHRITFANGSTSIASFASQINTQVGAGVASVDGTGHLVITSTTTGTGSTVTIGSSATDPFDGATITGLNGLTGTGTGNFTVTAGTNDKLTFKVDGGANQTITLAAGSYTASTLASQINTQLTNGSITGITASNNGGSLLLQNSVQGSGHTVQVVSGGSQDASASLGLGTTTATGTDANVGFGFSGASFTGNTQGTAPTTAPGFVSDGSFQTDGFTFSALANGADSQTINVTAVDSNGASHTTNVVLQNNTTSQNGATIDSALNSINAQLQQSNQAALQGITAVKYDDAGTEKIKFISASTKFNVTAGNTGSSTGLSGGGSTAVASVTGSGSTADISDQPTAQAAVSALARAVQALGRAQAVVGRGENGFTYAVSLAQSQVTNEAAAESQIRDADLAQQAANLSKAQILVQAGTAALAQANSAPQAILSLLKG